MLYATYYLTMTTKKTDKISVTAEDAGERIDVFLCRIYAELSRSTLQKYIKQGQVLVNDKIVKNSYTLKLDDEITLNLEEFGLKIEPENIPVEVLYEDETMAVINKPSNMLTHPTSIEKTGTLVNVLLYKFTQLCDCNGQMRPGIVHRLDRNTSGLLMIAKTNTAFEFLKEKMQNKAFTKKYYAIVSGNFDTKEGEITLPIGRHPTKPKKMTTRIDGKESITKYTVLESLKNYSLLDITLVTGRTHQIRVHFSAIGHPIVNDTLYGGAQLPVKTQEQVLQAYSITFVSPFDLQERTITINPDNDIIKTLNYLRNTK